MNWLAAKLTPEEKAALRLEIMVKSLGVPVVRLPPRHAAGALGSTAVDYELETEEP